VKIGTICDRAYNEHHEPFAEFYPRADGSMEPFYTYAHSVEEPPASLLLASPEAAWSHFLCSVSEYARKMPGAWLYHRIGPEFHTIKREDWNPFDFWGSPSWMLKGDVGYRVYCRFLISGKEPSNGV